MQANEKLQTDPDELALRIQAGLPITPAVVADAAQAEAQAETDQENHEDSGT